MNYKLIKKWFFRVVLTQICLTIAAFIWVDYHIDDMWGGHTVVVDHKKFKAPQALIAFKNVNALSVDGLSMIANQTVIINHGKIQAIGSDIPVPNSAKIIDGAGKYLIPGLVDSHVHLWQSANDLLLYLANGVTHVRELNGTEEHLRWRSEIENGRMGPKLFVASRRLGSKSKLKGWFEAWTAETSSISAPENADALLASFSNSKYDAVKVYSLLNKEDFTAIDSVANNVSIPLLGHIPITVELDDIWRSNLNELAHIEELTKALDREFGGYNSQNTEEFLQFVQARSEDISNKLIENNMAVVTTLWLMESFTKQKHDIHQALNEVELEYVNPGITELSPLSPKVMGWLPDSNVYRIGHGHSIDELQGNKDYWNTYAKAQHILFKVMVQKGVIMLAGTDANVPTTVPGFSMHDELQSLTNAGMTPSQALLSATAVPASWMKIKSGKIAQGYNADLVLLDANPLKNIKHTKSIDSVISNGRLIPRKQLDEMLSDVKNANDKSRKVDIKQYH